MTISQVVVVLTVAVRVLILIDNIKQLKANHKTLPKGHNHE